jgi:zinc protease
MFVGRGIDTHSDYKAIVNSLTPEKVSAFVRDVVLKPGNTVEVVMLPEDVKE